MVYDKRYNINNSRCLTAALFYAARASETGKQKTESFLFIDKAEGPNENKTAIRYLQL